MPYCGHVCAGGVGSLRSTDEAAEQRGATFGGSCGGKAATQGELCTIYHGCGSERRNVVSQVERCALILSTPRSKGRAVCGSSARSDLCGGRFVRIVPTVTPNSFFELSLSSNSHAYPSDHDHAASHDTFSA